MALRGRGAGELEIFVGGGFFIGCYKSDEEWFWPFKSFKPWTLVKINISMTCVYKEYGVKIKMKQEQ